jgi:hypothetical protein
MEDQCLRCTLGKATTAKTGGSATKSPAKRIGTPTEQRRYLVHNARQPVRVALLQVVGRLKHPYPIEAVSTGPSNPHGTASLRLVFSVFKPELGESGQETFGATSHLSTSYL